MFYDCKINIFNSIKIQISVLGQKNVLPLLEKLVLNEISRKNRIFIRETYTKLRY